MNNPELRTGSGPSVFTITAGAAITLIVAACATSTDTFREKLDPDTATTVTTLSRPIELLSQNTRGQPNDPFAYIAPFETDRQGERDLFLWVSAPQGEGPPAPPRILCNGQPLSLQPIGNEGPAASPGSTSSAGALDLSQISLSRAPYEAPVPWSAQWYFRLPSEGLKCLAGADGIALETRAPGGDQARFSAERKSIAALDAFVRR